MFNRTIENTLCFILELSFQHHEIASHPICFLESALFPRKLLLVMVLPTPCQKKEKNVLAPAESAQKKRKAIDLDMKM